MDAINTLKHIMIYTEWTVLFGQQLTHIIGISNKTKLNEI